MIDNLYKALPFGNDDNCFEIFGITLHFDDILIICLLFFLYNEGVKDQLLFISLIMLLLSWNKKSIEFIIDVNPFFGGSGIYSEELLPGDKRVNRYYNSIEILFLLRFRTVPFCPCCTKEGQSLESLF